MEVATEELVKGFGTRYGSRSVSAKYPPSTWGRSLRVDISVARGADSLGGGRDGSARGVKLGFSGGMEGSRVDDIVGVTLVLDNVV